MYRRAALQLKDHEIVDTALLQPPGSGQSRNPAPNNHHAMRSRRLGWLGRTPAVTQTMPDRNLWTQQFAVKCKPILQTTTDQSGYRNTGKEREQFTTCKTVLRRTHIAPILARNT